MYFAMCFAWSDIGSSYVSDERENRLLVHKDSEAVETGAAKPKLDDAEADKKVVGGEAISTRLVKREAYCLELELSVAFMAHKNHQQAALIKKFQELSHKLVQDNENVKIELDNQKQRHSFLLSFNQPPCISSQ